jgi:hypothetical protein
MVGDVNSPVDHPTAVEPARSADSFFGRNGYKAYLNLREEIFSLYRSESERVAV